jgi:hypothetical protein
MQRPVRASEEEASIAGACSAGPLCWPTERPTYAWLAGTDDRAHFAPRVYSLHTLVTTPSVNSTQQVFSTLVSSLLMNTKMNPLLFLCVSL